MILHEENIFVLETKYTTYAFFLNETGQAEHLYYGKRLFLGESPEREQILMLRDALREKREFQAGNMIAYHQEHLNVTLEDLCLEMSSYGKGDIREPFVDIRYANGSCTSDFIYDSHEIYHGKQVMRELPESHGTEDEVETLVLTLKDRNHNVYLKLYYSVYENQDVITKSSKLLNRSGEMIVLNRLMSNQLDFGESGYDFVNFTGAWAREMNKKVTNVSAGKFVNSSYTGSSSNRANPFVMIGTQGTDDKKGECYGMNLVYSGNHYETLEVNAYGKSRFVSGINPQNFSFHLSDGEEFEAPESIMCYSDRAYRGIGAIMQRFVREHIVPENWSRRERPVLLNSWEASYFKIDESKLLKLAKVAKETGIELFVMDDGWFKGRNDDSHSLGDWVADEKKLPNGLRGLSDKIKKLGLQFGIWVEPEMISVNSELYQRHSDWAIEIKGQSHSEGRNQRILDLTRNEVCDYLIESISRVIEESQADYVKWDMNRIFSDVYSSNLDADRQGEVFHRYILGLYQIQREITKKYPDVLFEGCAAGGNRFDLGELCFFPQIWASDDTDAIVRATMLENYTYGYPLSCISAHVSGCPNHQTLRTTPLSTRFHVAAFSVLGYECNLADLSSDELEEIKKQIEIYKKWRRIVLTGTFYGSQNDEIHKWTLVSKNKKYALGMLLQEKVTPNWQSEIFQTYGLSDRKKYHFYNIEQKIDVRKFGDLINTSTPVHIKNGSIAQNVVAKFVKMSGETEDYCVSGSVLNHAGVRLKQGFSSTGYNEKTRYFQDFDSRLYYIEEVK